MYVFFVFHRFLQFTMWDFMWNFTSLFLYMGWHQLFVKLDACMLISLQSCFEIALVCFKEILWIPFEFILNFLCSSCEFYFAFLWNFDKIASIFSLISYEFLMLFLCSSYAFLTHFLCGSYAVFKTSYLFEKKV